MCYHLMNGRIKRSELNTVIIMTVKEEPYVAPVLDPITWRAQGFSWLGFGHNDAFVLAHTKKSDGFYLYWGDVKRALDAGATHEQIIDWYTYPAEDG